jgi:hypothetical protein
VYWPKHGQIDDELEHSAAAIGMAALTISQLAVELQTEL